MVLTTYSLEEFVFDMQQLIAGRPSQSWLFDAGSRHLEKLVQNPNVIPEEFRRPSGRGRRPNLGHYSLHRGEGLFVSAIVWGAGEHTGPHDHQTWGMIGVLGNGIEETRYRRVDDGSRDGFAQLVKDRVAKVLPGEVSMLTPVIDEIHAMDNSSDRPTVEIHVYGKDLVGLERRRFDLETGAITPFTSGALDNC